MASGKIGDVVFTRLNGQQVSRVRNRNPKNPRTNAQLYQRAIMATLMQAYSAGKAIFDHSFQGKSVGSVNQQLFMSLNLKYLREQVAYEIKNNVSDNDCVAHCVYPGSTNPVPNAYYISRGTYDQKAFTARVVSGGVRFTLPAPTTNETIAAYCERVGLIPDDYYTFCFFLSGDNELYVAPDGEEFEVGKCYDCQFGFARLHVKTSVLTDDHQVDTYEDLFDIDETANCAPGFIFDEITHGISLEALDYQQNGAGALGCIRSRKDADLRSTSQMYCPSLADCNTNAFGLVSPYVLESWQAGSQQLGDSDLILEGGGGKKNSGGNTHEPIPVTSAVIRTIENEESEYYGYKVLGDETLIPIAVSEPETVRDNPEYTIVYGRYMEGEQYEYIYREMAYNEGDFEGTLQEFLQSAFGMDLYPLLQIISQGESKQDTRRAVSNSFTPALTNFRGELP